MVGRARFRPPWRQHLYGEGEEGQAGHRGCRWAWPNWASLPPVGFLFLFFYCFFCKTKIERKEEKEGFWGEIFWGMVFIKCHGLVPHVHHFVLLKNLKGLLL